MKPEIEQKIARNLGITATVNEALRIEKELRDINEMPEIRDLLNNSCQFCKKPDHTADNCRTLAQNITKPNLENEILIC